MVSRVTKKESATYKFRTPTGNNAYYFTIAGDWMFLNSKELNDIKWIVPLLCSYSEHLKDGKPVSHIVSRMKESFDPSGGYIIPDGSGIEVNGMVHHLGILLERHHNS
jgi:hypothetical protein